MTHLIIDSTTDIPREYIDRFDITVLPLHVLIEDKEYLDRVTITTNEVYAYMKQGITPKTSQIEYTATKNALRDLLMQGEDLICIAFSSRMSGTCQLISMIMDELRTEYPDRKMITIDSKGGSMATGLVAIEAGKVLETGASYEDTVKRINYCISEVEHVFCITDLTWMVRGGRISRTKGYTANLLNIKPILDVSEGEMEVIEKIHGTKKPLKEWRKSFGNAAGSISHRQSVLRMRMTRKQRNT